jgi:hypothetical protein
MLAMLESRFAGWLAKSPTPFSTHDQSQPAAAVVTMRHDAFLLPKAPGLLKACPDRNRRVLGSSMDSGWEHRAEGKALLISVGTASDTPYPKAPGQSSYSAATLVGGSMWDTAAILAGSRKAVLKKFENVSELGSKRQ